MTFRSLPRPSSAISALAFTLCSYMLDLLLLAAVFRFRFFSFEPLRSRLYHACRYVINPLRCSQYSLALLSLCSFQDAHEDREALRPPDSSKRYSLREIEL